MGCEASASFKSRSRRACLPGTPTKRIAHADNAGKFTDYVVGGSLITQLALANLGCIAVHIMASRASSPRQPDWVCFDIDPESGKFADAARAGLQVKAALDLLKLASFAKTSGSRGLHVLVPIRAGPDADEVLAFAEAFVARVAAAHPDELTVEHSVNSAARPCLSGSVSERFWSNRGGALLRPAARESSRFDPLGMVRSQAHARPFRFQYGELCQAA